LQHSVGIRIGVVVAVGGAEKPGLVAEILPAAAAVAVADVCCPLIHSVFLAVVVAYPLPPLGVVEVLMGCHSLQWVELSSGGISYRRQA